MARGKQNTRKSPLTQQARDAKKQRRIHNRLERKAIVKELTSIPMKFTERVVENTDERKAVEILETEKPETPVV